MSFEKLHQRALECVKNFRTAENDLLSILQEIDDKKGFRWLGYASLYQYATTALKLPENQAYALITVSRKSKEVPELKQAISDGVLSASQARRITPVLTKANHKVWIDRAASLTQRALEKEIVKVAPKEAVREQMGYVQPNRIKLVCGISEELMKKLERVKVLPSQKEKRA